MYSNLNKHIHKYINLDNESIEVLHRYIKPEILKKREFLLQEGQVCRSIYFVEQGCLRMYFLNDKMSEQTTQFALEHWWISDFASFMGNKPSEYFIQAVEKSEILTIDTAAFEEMLKELPQMERYFRIIMEREWASAQQE
jgi:CRP/FNR family transcriptional regulator, anaerobic regulatory protein